MFKHYQSPSKVLTDRHELYIKDAEVATQTSTSDKLDRITSSSSSATDYGYENMTVLKFGIIMQRE